MSTPRVRVAGSGDTRQVIYGSGGEQEGRKLYSGDNPRLSIVRRLEHVPLQSHTLLIIYSPLLWYGVGELVERAIAAGATGADGGGNLLIAAIEFDEALAGVARQYMPAGLRDQEILRALLPATAENLAELQDELGQRDIRHVHAVAASGGYRVAHDRYHALTVGLREYINAHNRNRMTARVFGRLWVRNFLKNLHSRYTGRDIAEYRIHGPVVVVGAGCSLEEEIGSLQVLQERCVIITVDSALPVLCAQGIFPDIVVVTEAQSRNIGDFIGCLARPQGDRRGRRGGRGVLVVADMCSHPSITRVTAAGGLAMYSSQFGDVGLLGYCSEHNLLPMQVPPLGSVGVVALHIALKLSTDTVYTTGFDFCYRIGKSHARGAPQLIENNSGTCRLSPYPLFDLCMRRPYFKTVNRRGEAVVSELPLQGYAAHLREALVENGRVFECSSGSIIDDHPRIAKLADIKASPGGGGGAGKRGRERAWVEYTRAASVHTEGAAGEQSRHAHNAPQETGEARILRERRDMLGRLEKLLTEMLETGKIDGHPESAVAPLNKRLRGAPIPLDFLLFDSPHLQNSAAADTYLHHSARDYLRRITRLLNTAP